MTTGVKWSLKGDYLEACNCDWGCPCKMGAKPSNGSCDGLGGFQIREGSYGDVSLDGLGMAFVLRAPGPLFEGNLTFKTFVDERASADQRSALESILSGDAGGLFAALAPLISDNRGVEYAPVQMSEDRRTLTIPGAMEIVDAAIINPLTNEEQEVMLSNSLDPFAPSGILGKSFAATSSDPDLSFDHSGQHSYRGAFELAGP